MMGILKFIPYVLLAFSFILFLPSLNEAWFSSGGLKLKLFKACIDGMCQGYGSASGHENRLRVGSIVFTFFSLILYIVIGVLWIFGLIKGKKEIIPSFGIEDLINIGLLFVTVICVILCPALFGSAKFGISFSHGFYLSLFACLFGLAGLITLMVLLILPKVKLIMLATGASSKA